MIGVKYPIVRKGPEAVVRWIYANQSWLLPVCGLLVVASVLAAAWKIGRDGVDPDIIDEVASIAVMIGVIYSVIPPIQSFATFPYLLDVVIAWITGVGVASIVVKAVPSEHLAQDINEVLNHEY